MPAGRSAARGGWWSSRCSAARSSRNRPARRRSTSGAGSRSAGRSLCRRQMALLPDRGNPTTRTHMATRTNTATRIRPRRVERPSPGRRAAACWPGLAGLAAERLGTALGRDAALLGGVLRARRLGRRRRKLGEKVRAGALDVHFLMLSVAVGAAAVGAWHEGALLLVPVQRVRGDGALRGGPHPTGDRRAAARRAQDGDRARRRRPGGRNPGRCPPARA